MGNEKDPNQQDGHNTQVADENTSPRLSVILCSHNPRPKLLRWALSGLLRQSLPYSLWELVIVDNNSSEPVLTQELQSLLAPIRSRTVEEPRPGLNFARCAGIRTARSDLLVFMDDDNQFASGYLSDALQIASENPQFGAFGGITEGVFECPVEPWKEPLLEMLGVRNYGSEAISSNEDCWGKWEPIGAGMVVRKSVGEQFEKIVERNSVAQRLDRSGSGLLCAGDSLLARMAYRTGFACSYQPRLTLKHYIKSNRLKSSYLAELMRGHGRSYVLLDQTLGKPIPEITRIHAATKLIECFQARVRKEGRIGFLRWYWDLGYHQELLMVQSAKRKSTQP